MCPWLTAEAIPDIPRQNTLRAKKADDPQFASCRPSVSSLGFEAKDFPNPQKNLLGSPDVVPDTKLAGWIVPSPKGVDQKQRLQEEHDMISTLWSPKIGPHRFISALASSDGLLAPGRAWSSEIQTLEDPQRVEVCK